MYNDTLALILAAGKGSRMNTTLPKPLVKINGVPMIKRIVNILENIPIINIAIVVNNNSNSIQNYLGEDYIYVKQLNQLGTADAVKSAMNIIKNYNKIIVLTADSALIKETTIIKLLDSHISSKVGCTFLSAEFPFKLPYARVIREDQTIVKCIEEKDANDKELRIKELFTSHYIFKTTALINHIHKIKKNIKSGELYLTDIINILINNNINVEGIKISDYKNLMGINTHKELKIAEKWLNE